MTVAEALLEAAIAAELTIVMHDELFDRDARVSAFERAQELHTQRTPAMVERIEREKRLRK